MSLFNVFNVIEINFVSSAFLIGFIWFGSHCTIDNVFGSLLSTPNFGDVFV